MKTIQDATGEAKITVGVLGAYGKMGSLIATELEGHEQYNVIRVGRGDDMGCLQDADFIFGCTKPQGFDERDAGGKEIGPAFQLRQYIGKRTVFASIMAGKTAEELTELLGTGQVIQIMPNLALENCLSTTGWYAQSGVDEERVQQVAEIISRWGRSVRLDSADEFHAFTVLAGAGPAYFFDLADMIEESARRWGLGKHASTIANGVLAGAGSFATGECNFAKRANDVTSKGGVAARVREVQRELGWQSIFRIAIDEGVDRSRQLGKR